MNFAAPHYLLFAETHRAAQSGSWHFTLRSVDGRESFEAGDTEPAARGERLALLTVVRALESLDQPSRVTLVGCNSYIRQGVQYGLSEWRDNGWRWEFFGHMVPVKNGDLWQRMDRVLRFHRVDCRIRRIDPPHPPPGTSRPNQVWEMSPERAGQKADVRSIRFVVRRGVKYLTSLLPEPRSWSIVATVRRWRRNIGRSLSPRPWGE